MTLLNPATDKLLRWCFGSAARNQFLLEMDGQKLDDIVFQSIGALQIANGVVRRFEIKVDISPLPLAPDFICQFLAPPVFGLDKLRAGLHGNRLHLLDECVRLLIGDRRTDNEQRLVELHVGSSWTKAPIHDGSEV